MSEKKTGLGGSLLLQRTTPASQTAERPDAQASEAPERLDAEQPPAPKAKPKDLRDKCTLYLDAVVNQQLDIVARIERRQRSEIVSDILRLHLPKYRIDRG